MRQFLLALAALLATALPPMAQTAPDSTIRIGTREAPPFAMKTADGSWQGISIDLLDRIAADAMFEFELVETDLEGMIRKVADGDLDASIAAMTVTLDRERVVDFSHPFFLSGLGVAVATVPGSALFAVLEALTSRDFLVTIGLLTGLLSLVGFLVWLAERRGNPGEFEPDRARGIFSGIWWAAVTMTTVGYGDKTPVSVLGRLLGLVWMFSALILTALIIAQLSAAITNHRIAGTISSPADLARQQVGYVRDAASLDDLRALGARPTPFAGVREGFEALRDGRITAFVHDEPILIWMAATTDTVEVTPIRFAPQNYAIVLPEDSPFREEINQAILEILDSVEWPGIVRSYLGSGG